MKRGETIDFRYES